MRALVTGSSGFLGHNIARHLATLPDYEVTGFDRRAGASRDPFATIAGDLRDLDSVVAACHGVDVVVHFGGVGDVDLATARPDLAVSANVVGTANVAVASLGSGAKVVYASTWEVYGPVQYEPVDERHPCEPDHLYAVTKLLGEELLQAMHRTAGLGVAILRLGTAYGPGMRPNAVIRRFRDAGYRGEPITVQGSGDQWRQFTHTTDLARAVESASASQEGYLLVNVVSSEAVTIRHLAETIARRYSVPLTFASARLGDPPPARISSSEAGRVLRWRAEIGFDAGLAAILSAD